MPLAKQCGIFPGCAVVILSSFDLRRTHVVPGILFVGLVAFTWKCAKRHSKRKIRRRWQNAYLMVNAHLATKKLRAEAEVWRPCIALVPARDTWACAQVPTLGQQRMR